ncbi:hypothetical protein C0039_15770 [Pseudohalioglobus lutimaris]|uniref:Membrane transport protein MMPL domain-containing protein n=2 Tax=Pseudohalioglobus lutimaris TaxID=1737061 RepID=A0A2N5WZJ3_9GAMM|nr:hypothetical protein C0039_15770 [Pseudohalioglobus lutimaris]
MLALALLRWPQPPWLSTDFQHLLPETNKQYWTGQANKAVAASLESEVLLLVRGPENAPVGRFLAEAVVQLEEAGFAEEGFELSEARRWQALARTLQPFSRGLLRPGDFISLDNDAQGYLRGLRALLYSPLGGPFLAGLQEDPLGLFRNYLQSAAPNSASVDSAVGVTEIRVIRVPRAMSGFNRLAGLYQQYGSLRERAQNQGLEFHAVGAPLYSAYGVESGRREMSTIGGASLLLLATLLVWVLGSVRGLGLMLLSVGVGVAAGLSVTVLVLGEIHILTLVFGASLVGISADYSFHYLAHSRLPGWTPAEGLVPVYRGLLLGVLSSATAFAALTLLPFPGVRQIGLFMASGLFGSFLTVCLLYPSLYRGSASARELPRFLQGRPLAYVWWFAPVTVVVLAMPGLLLLHSQDDVRDFYAVPAELQYDEDLIGRLRGNINGSQYLLVQAADENALLTLEEQLRRELDVTLTGISQLVPSVEAQLASLSLQRRLSRQGVTEAFLASLGFDQNFIDSWQAALMAPYEPLALKDLQVLDLPLGTGGFLGCRDGQCASWMRMDGEPGSADIERLAALAAAVRVVDPIEDINQLMGEYRRGILASLLLGSLAVMILLVLTLGPLRALHILALPVAACLGSLGAIGYIQGYYGIINMLALLLVLGVGLDYGIFRGVTAPAKQGATSLAISLSAVTSILVFGMLALSDTPVIAEFGLTIALGLTLAYILSWFSTGWDDS